MKLILKKDLISQKSTANIIKSFYNDHLKDSSKFTLFMFGGLGAGKTFLTREIAGLIGIDKDQVVSPTYTYHQLYTYKDHNLAHFDFYRLSEGQAFQKGLLENIEDSNTNSIIEWSDHLSSEERLLFGGDIFFIEIKHGAGAGMRRIKISQ